MQDNVVKIKLGDPIKFGSEVIDELEMRTNLKAKDLRKLPADPGTGDMLNLAAHLCNITPRQIDELSIADTMKVMDELGKQMPTVLPTGEK